MVLGDKISEKLLVRELGTNLEGNGTSIALHPRYNTKTNWHPMYKIDATDKKSEFVLNLPQLQFANAKHDCQLSRYLTSLSTTLDDS